ncbi:MAG TPA: hypothetical protein EYP28_03565 [Methanophagales archaeon]|nr:hypothetical protein [Methanophagales archaeon]
MDDRALRATIGLTTSEFNQLAQGFGPEIEKEGWLRYESGFEQGNRERKPGDGGIGIFSLKNTEGTNNEKSGIR